ncbi:hypothetical protein LR013_04430 [candidate division NPL-UPA2 bacterium]|nr:hypothetical protein [candidate division NPL-UPA2 bacterium]
MRKMREILILAVMLMVASGCRTLPRRQNDGRAHLLRRERSLAVERHEKAMKKGDFASAQLYAEDIIAKWPEESFGFELSGKVALRTGRFEEAEKYFLIALGKSDRPNDKERIEDLLFLARGLTAYSEGDIKNTKDYWSQIRGRKLATQVRREASRLLGIEIEEGLR